MDPLRSIRNGFANGPPTHSHFRVASRPYRRSRRAGYGPAATAAGTWRVKSITHPSWHPDLKDLMFFRYFTATVPDFNPSICTSTCTLTHSSLWRR